MTDWLEDFDLTFLGLWDFFSIERLWHLDLVVFRALPLLEHGVVLLRRGMDPVGRARLLQEAEVVQRVQKVVNTVIIGHCDTVGNGKSVTTSNLSQYPIISVYLSTVFVWFCLVSGVSLHRRHLFNFPEHWNSESRFAVTLICPPESHLGAPIVEIPPEEKSFRGFYINLFSFWGLIKILKSNNSPFLWCKIMSNPIEIIFSINAPFFSFTCPFFLPVRPWDGATRRANL